MESDEFMDFIGHGVAGLNNIYAERKVRKNITPKETLKRAKRFIDKFNDKLQKIELE